MDSSSILSRRSFVAGAALLLLASPALALNGDQAQSLVKRAVNDINSVIASNRSEAAMLREFEKIFTRYADVNIIALTTLGPARRSASSSQVRAYADAFRGYFTRKYGKRFNEFSGGAIEVGGTRMSRSFVEVDSTAKLKGTAPFGVKWQVSDRSGSPKIINIIIEGVNTLSSERIEIGAMLDRRGGDIDRLIQDLKQAG